MLPYCMIYMGGQQDVNLVLYIAGLVVASLLVLGAFIFVWASYPSEKVGNDTHSYDIQSTSLSYVHPILAEWQTVCAPLCQDSVLLR